MQAYIVVSLLTGARTEELRPLTWPHVRLDSVPPFIEVWHSVRAKGETKTSLLSDGGVPIEKIARLVGHSSTSTTERVYRHQIRPVVQSGAEVMDRLFVDPRRAPGEASQEAWLLNAEGHGPRCGGSVAFCLVHQVGVRGLEPRTSSLSGKRSNRLSYTPKGVSLEGLGYSIVSGSVLQSVSRRVTSMPPMVLAIRL